jgi:Fe-S oxidoreductase
MALSDYEFDMRGCSRCSYCKFIPHVLTNHKEFSTVCPSIARYNFHSYSAGGKLVAGLSFLRGRVGYTDKLLDVIYQCQMCGACDVSCKNGRDMEPYEVLSEFRATCVEDGQLIPAHMLQIDNLRKEDNMMMRLKAERNDWAKNLAIKELTKEPAEVLFHVGCRYSFDDTLWPTLQSAMRILQKAQVDFAVMGTQETCCGGRAYQMGYKSELTKYADHNIETWKTYGVKTVVTACADCYQTFNVLYDKIGKKPPVEVLHITQYLERLMREGKLKPQKKVSMKVTYHDPCHLGRLAEPWIHWKGTRKYVMGGMFIWDPPREFRRGGNGVYDIPRDLIKAVPGTQLVEMDRIREYAWCCGAGGGVKQAYDDFAVWTAEQRLIEAKSTGAEALVTACPWCISNFKDASSKVGNSLKIYDIVELLEKSL